MQKLGWILIAVALARAVESATSRTARAQPDRRGWRWQERAQLTAQSAEELKAPLAKVDDVTIHAPASQGAQSTAVAVHPRAINVARQKKEFSDSTREVRDPRDGAYKRGLDKDPEVVRT